MFTTKPKIRTRTVAVTVKKPAPGSTAANTSPSISGNGMRRPNGATPTSRFTLTPSSRSRPATAQTREPARQSLSVSNQNQRRRKVTPSTPQWASSSDESSDDEDVRNRKRQKTSSSIEPTSLNRCLEPDMQRRIRCQASDARRQETDRGATDSEEKKPGREEKLVHGLKMSRGEWVKKFKPAFPGHENLVVELQYPSSSRPERFETVVPYDPSDFNPLGDIYYSMEEIIQNYLPSDISASLSSDTDGSVRLLKRAVLKNSPEDFKTALSNFNGLLRKKLEDKSITKVLDATHAIPLSLTRRILAQVYQRTVSPHAHLLRRVNSRETTYGELLPSFAHTIFQQTALKSNSVFVDLGSGVGNVVLQAALQTGAESWGMEILPTPSEYALLQASELRARAKLWNISLGPIDLYEGNFLESAAINNVLPRADVILCNNKVFGEKTNGALLDKFLDLKIGAKVVSLASFMGGGSKAGIRNEQSIANLFEEERFDSGTDSVSWASESVEYFIATKLR